MVEDTPPNWDELLAKMGKIKDNKKARVILRIERDEAYKKFVHIATPTPEINKDDVVGKDYNI